MLYPPEEAVNMDETEPFVGPRALDDTFPFTEINEDETTVPPVLNIPLVVITDAVTVELESHERKALLLQNLLTLSQSLLTSAQKVFTLTSGAQDDTYTEEKLNELISQMEKACTATGQVDRCFRLTQSFDDNGGRHNKRRMTTLQQQNAKRPALPVTAFTTIPSFVRKPTKKSKSTITAAEIVERNNLSSRLTTFVDEMDSLRKCPTCKERAASTKDCYKCDNCLQWIHTRCIHACP
jgi:hypothetical protein